MDQQSKKEGRIAFYFFSCCSIALDQHDVLPFWSFKFHKAISHLSDADYKDIRYDSTSITLSVIMGDRKENIRI